MVNLMKSLVETLNKNVGRDIAGVSPRLFARVAKGAFLMRKRKRLRGTLLVHGVNPRRSRMVQDSGNR